MCKVLVIPKITDKTREKAKTFVYTIAEKMSLGNNDGMGYAAVDSAGNLFGERWFYNMEFYNIPKAKVHSVVEKALGTFATPTTKINLLQKDYSSFGDAPSFDKMTAITLHARAATSAKVHSNTHPFVDKDTSLIHNGVIRNEEKFNLKLSTCDSEAILISYLENKVNLDPYKNLNNMSDSLVGYYVSAVFARDKEGKRVLDIFKANNDNLVCAYVYDLDSLVFTTSKANLEETCKELKFTYSSPVDLADGMFVRLLPGTNDCLDRYSFKPSKKYETTWTGNTESSCNLPASNNTKPTKVTSFEEYKKTQLAKRSQNLTEDIIDFMKKPSSIRVLTKEEQDQFDIKGA